MAAADRIGRYTPPLNRRHSAILVTARPRQPISKQQITLGGQQPCETVGPAAMNSDRSDGHYRLYTTAGTHGCRKQPAPMAV